MRAKLLALAYTIGRELRGAEGPPSYPHALEMLADLEDLLKDYALLSPPASERRLCGRIGGYYPTRHPNKPLREDSQL